VEWQFKVGTNMLHFFKNYTSKKFAAAAAAFNSLSHTWIVTVMEMY
jgi:hypothetical protein